MSTIIIPAIDILLVSPPDSESRLTPIMAIMMAIALQIELLSLKSVIIRIVVNTGYISE